MPRTYVLGIVVTQNLIPGENMQKGQHKEIGTATERSYQLSKGIGSEKRMLKSMFFLSNARRLRNYF
jgi:hypothetical protein